MHTPYDLNDYAAWRLANLMDNSERGIVAEYLVAQATGDTNPGFRNWRPYDVDTRDSFAVEVKTTGYLQSWGYANKRRKLPTNPSWRISAPTYWWDAPTGEYIGDKRRRWSDVHVFALHAAQDREKANPLDPDQWIFYVLDTNRVNALFGAHEGRLSLARMQRLEREASDGSLRSVDFGGLDRAVRRVGYTGVDNAIDRK